MVCGAHFCTFLLERAPPQSLGRSSMQFPNFELLFCFLTEFVFKTLFPSC
jgi:hypothetical protein